MGCPARAGRGSDWGILTLDLADKRHMYWLALALVALGYYLARRVVRSPFGHALVAVRESEERAAAIGIDVNLVKRLALVMSGALSGMAGVLFAVYQNFVLARAAVLGAVGRGRGHRAAWRARQTLGLAGGRGDRRRHQGVPEAAGPTTGWCSWAPSTSCA